MQIARPLSLAVLLASLVFMACSSEAAQGEECEESGKTDGECESGSVCGKETTGALVCLKVCKEQTDCPAGKECNGVDGTSIKGCRNK